MIRYILLLALTLLPSLSYSQGKVTRHQNTHTAPQKPMPTKGIENGHEWVDLGLPSGTKWATCNVGTDKFDYYGDYFVWGNPNFVTDATIDWKKRPTHYKLNVFRGLPNHDPATASWGAKWCTPNKDQWEELIANCSFSWTNEYDGGIWVKSKRNGEKIYLPACGGCSGTQGYDYAGIVGMYWTCTSAPTTNTFGKEITDFAYYFSFIGNSNNEFDGIKLSTNPRQACLSIRPVLGK